MAFPTSLTNAVDNVTDATAAQLNALEAKIGIDSSAVTTSHDYKLSGVTGSDKAASVAGSETLTNKTLTSPVINTPTLTATGSELTSPKVVTGINDTNNNELLKVTATGSAVNELTLANAATGANPTLSATGGDTDVGLDVKVKGAGRIRMPRVFGIEVFASGVNMSTGDAKRFFRVPAELNGSNLVGISDSVYTAGTTGTCDIQIRNKTDSVDMLSTKLTIDSTETDSSTAATAAVIDTTHDDVATGDILAIDVDAVHTTPAKGLWVEFRFELP